MKACQGILGTRQDILTAKLDEITTSYELSREGEAKIEAVDSYLEEAIRDGRPMKTLIATDGSARSSTIGPNRRLFYPQGNG